MKNFNPSADSVESLLPFYKEINSALINKEYDKCDLFLKNIEVDKLSNVLLVGMLRLTFSYKKVLPSREELFKKIETEIIKRNYNPKSLLKGMYENK